MSFRPIALLPLASSEAEVGLMRLTLEPETEVGRMSWLFLLSGGAENDVMLTYPAE